MNPDSEGENATISISTERLLFIAWAAGGVVFVVVMWMAVERWHDFGLERYYRLSDPNPDDATRYAMIDGWGKMIESIWHASLAWSALGLVWSLRRGVVSLGIALAVALCTTYCWIFQNMP